MPEVWFGRKDEPSTKLAQSNELARISHSRALTDTWRCTWAARVAYRAPGRMQVVFGGTERAVSA